MSHSGYRGGRIGKRCQFDQIRLTRKSGLFRRRLVYRLPAQLLDGPRRLDTEHAAVFREIHFARQRLPQDQRIDLARRVSMKDPNSPRPHEIYLLRAAHSMATSLFRPRTACNPPLDSSTITRSAPVPYSPKYGKISGATAGVSSIRQQRKKQINEIHLDAI